MLFVDDTSVFYSIPDLNCTISAVNNDLGQIDLFMKANKLSVNITKTNFIIFAARQKPVGFPINPVLYDGVLLKQEKVVKFLTSLMSTKRGSRILLRPRPHVSGYF